MVISIGKYLDVEQWPDIPGRKTHIWAVRSKNGGILGEIYWYGPWRQYNFNPRPDTTFSSGCLNDIATFILSIPKKESP